MRELLGTIPEAPPPPQVAAAAGANSVGDHRLGTGDANFDNNMVIILAALLCALICALGLNSIVRCALRCGRRIAFETPEEAAARLATTGLKKKALRRIPVAVYGAEGANIPAAATECPICLGEFADGEKVRVLPKCNHGFHVRCIDTWLASHSSCPTCRHSLLDRTAAESSERVAAAVETRVSIRFGIEQVQGFNFRGSMAAAGAAAAGGGAAFRWVLQLHRDVPKAARFYSQGLGLTVDVCTQRWAELRSGPLNLALMHPNSDFTMQKGYSSMLSFTVDDISGTVTKLMALGAELDGPIKYEIHGKVAALRCIDGHMLGLYEPA